MKILFAGNKQRGRACMEALAAAGHEIVGVIAHPSKAGVDPGPVANGAVEHGFKLFQPDRVNEESVIEQFRALEADVVVLAGYGQIIKRPMIDLAPLGCVNLHGGRLPKYRGSSPMNWALMRGDKEFTISIIQVDEGVDTGDILTDRTFPIGPEDTIADLQRAADEAFPTMLTEVVDTLDKGIAQPVKQDEAHASYFPLRFPSDGFILWDQHTAEEIYNKVRALTKPFPGAYTYYEGSKVMLLHAKRTKLRYHGEPGRVYLKNKNGLLVCASDVCLWVTECVDADSGEDLIPAIKRYGKFSTVRDAVEQLVSGGAS